MRSRCPGTTVISPLKTIIVDFADRYVDSFQVEKRNRWLGGAARVPVVFVTWYCKGEVAVAMVCAKQNRAVGRD